MYTLWLQPPLHNYNGCHFLFWQCPIIRKSASCWHDWRRIWMGNNQLGIIVVLWDSLLPHSPASTHVASYPECMFSITTFSTKHLATEWLPKLCTYSVNSIQNSCFFCIESYTEMRLVDCKMQEGHYSKPTRRHLNCLLKERVVAGILHKWHKM